MKMDKRTTLEKPGMHKILKETGLEKVFKSSNTHSPQHLLYKDLIESKPGLAGQYSKLSFYIEMQSTYGNGYSSLNGTVVPCGYFLEVIGKEAQK